MTWTLIIAAVLTGVFSDDARMLSVLMQNREACLAAAESMAEFSSRNVTFTCISSETGEVVSTRGRKRS